MSTDKRDTAGNSVVTFVNRFTVDTAPEEFERVFAEASEFMAHQDGFLCYALLRHIAEQHSYINIAQWRDAESFRRAVKHPAFQSHAAALRTLSTSEPNLYTPRQAFPVETTDVVSGSVVRRSPRGAVSEKV